ncbi:hypothetical protein QYE76_012029 [Lolium multiflorum]|uniref:Uncharacterized protein n=1 Tax=Lolium multiflorum TaxID=4521 RepID=A0AAD8TYH0_LOLMU|nr:hypothetical protein QYE76_012029 [Lolium multiflorum]
MMSSAALGSAAAAAPSVPASAGAAPSPFPVAPASPFLASQPLAWARSRLPSSTMAADHAAPSIPAGSVPPDPVVPIGSSAPAVPPSPGGLPPPSQLYGAPPPSYYGQYGAPGGWPSAPPSLGAYAAPGGYGAPAPGSWPPASSTYGAPHGTPAYGGYPSPSYAAPGGWSTAPPPTAPAPLTDLSVYAPPRFPPAPPPPPPPEHPGSASGPFYFAHLIPVKLKVDNYLAWRAQVLPLLRSRYLEGYVDGTYPCPSPYDPAYHAWVAQDQAILSAIQSSLTESVSSLVIFAATSREAWGALHASFTSQSHARAHAIRTQLGEVKLLDRSVTEYFNKVTGLADTLAAIGQPLRPEDFTSYVLNGLDEDYDNLCENIDARETPIPPRELYARLLATEQRVKKKHAAPSTANAAYRGGGKNPKTPTGGGKPPASPSPTPQPSPAARPPGVTTGGRPRACCPCCGAQQACQLCGLDGHIASRCHRRFKQDFLGIGNNGKGNEKQVALASHEQGSTPSYPIDHTWYMDTGATNHLTSEMGKLSTQEPYRGNDQVRTANGAGSGHEGRAS